MFDLALQSFTKSARQQDRVATQALAEAFLAAPPSGKIEMAIADLEAAERSPHYAIDMDTWHTPAPDQSRCYVCFAGAVVANRHAISPHQTYVGPFPAVGPREFAAGERWDDLFNALDEFRIGYVEAFLTLEGSMTSEQVRAFAVEFAPDDPFGSFPGHVSYEHNRAAFKSWARGIAGKLKANGF